MVYKPHLLERRLPSGPHLTIEETHASQGEVLIGLQEGGYTHVVPFSGMYINVTGGVKQARRDGRAKRPDELERAVGEFNWQFDKQLWALTAGNLHNISLPWRVLLCSYVARIAAPGAQVGTGMAAHVTGDLPYLVATIGASEAYLNQDYTLMVGDVIKDKAHEQSRHYLPFPTVIRDRVTHHTVMSIAEEREEAKAKGKELETAYRAGNMTLANLIEAEIDRSAAKKTRRVLYSGGLLLGSVAATQWWNGRQVYNQ